MTGPRDDGVTPGRELATVHHLPARVIDAEIVTDDRPVQQVLYARRMQGYRSDVQTVARVTRAGVTHPRTVTAAKFAARQSAYVLAGLGVVVKRAWEAKTNSVANRQMKAAEARGDTEGLQWWWQAREQAKKDQHSRVMEWLRAPVEWLRAMLVGVVAAVAMLVLLGIAIAAYTHDVGDVLAPLRLAIWLIWATWTVLLFLGAFLPVIAVTVIVTVLWVLGKRDGVTPTYLAPPGVKRDVEPITPSKVVTAMRDLGIAPLAKAIKAMGDAGAGMLSPIRIAGCGVEVDVTLPPGVTTAEVMARRRKLAENLDRHEHEVFPTVAPQPRTVRVWAADSGALDEPIGPSPLEFDDELTADVRTGKAPWGETLQGNPWGISLWQKHLLITGLSNQGKTAAMRSLALWVAHDRTAQFRIADLKGDGDWTMFQPLCEPGWYIEGPTDEHVARATEMVESLVEEMEARLLEPERPRYPLFGIVDEAQVAYMCPEKDEQGRPYGGKSAKGRYLKGVRKVHNQGRAVSVVLWEGTQDPTDENLPKISREGNHVRCSLVVGSEEQAKMALGAKAVDGGAAPHLLRQGLDKGTLVAAGDVGLAPSETSVTVRTHYIDTPTAAEIAARALARRGPARPLVIEQDRDLLDDVDEALSGDEAVRASDMVVRLRRLAPRWAAYRSLTGAKLVELLGEEGVEVRMKDGYPLIRADRVQAARAGRSE